VIDMNTSLPKRWQNRARDAFGIFMCLLALGMMGFEIYQHGGWWALLLAVVLIGGMAS